MNPNTSLDLDGKNNTATLILSAQTKKDDTYVPSVDCPLITATELDHNTVLVQSIPVDYNGEPYVPSRGRAQLNIMAERRSLQGLRIKLDGASTVVGYEEASSAYAEGFILSNGTVSAAKITVGDRSDYAINPAHNAVKGSKGAYTFSNGVLEITGDVEAFSFSCRPVGTNCKWQTYSIVSSLTPRKRAITVTREEGCTVTKKETYKEERTSTGQRKLHIVPTTVSYDADRTLGGTYSRSSPTDVDEKLVITARSGTAATVEFTSTDNYANAATSQGKTTIYAGRVTVATDAKSTDSVNTKYIQVIVED